MTLAERLEFSRNIYLVIRLSRVWNIFVAVGCFYSEPVLDSLMIIVFNPVAGRRRAHLLWRVLDVLAANGVRLDLAETHRAGHAEALAREAARRGEQMVVAAGGDGTIAEVGAAIRS